MPVPERQLGGESIVRLSPEPGKAELLQNGESKAADSPLRNGHDQVDGSSLDVNSVSADVSALRMADGNVGAAAAASEPARQCAGAGHAGSPSAPPPPTNPMITVLLTDLYQITMAYAYWKADKHKDHAVFDLFHRKNPFDGEYTVFAGLEECVRFAANLRFLPRDIEYLQAILPPSCEEEFFQYLATLDCSAVRIFSIPEGSVCFPRVPMMRIEGPLLVTQLLETTFLVLVNYASLVATNAARHRRVAGDKKLLLEFGLRRAQGPDGGISASRYCYMGGFDATSNVEAARLFNIPPKGTHSHAFVTSFMGMHELKKRSLPYAQEHSGLCPDFVALVQKWLKSLQGLAALQGTFSETNESELASFTSYALAFPSQFQALVDTYDVMRSGVPNFCAVALALHELGYKAVGIRLDSGDLAYLSQQARHFFQTVANEFGLPWFARTVITASNDINEQTLDALNKQGHEIDAFGIGTHLVTCVRQPALGCVYKLVEISGQPRIKLSEDMDKVTIPGRKECFRLYGREGYPLVDLMLRSEERTPQAGERILCRHPFSESKRAIVIPQSVERLYRCYWDGPNAVGDPVEVEGLPSLNELRQRCRKQLEGMREDHIRGLNPTPYKVSVSDQLYTFIHDLWLAEAPIGELR